MFRRRHWRSSLTVSPKNCVEYHWIYGIRASEIHSRGFFCTLAFGRVGLVDQTVIAITPIRFVCRLIAEARKQRGHNRSIGVVLIHGRQIEQRFDSVNHVDRGVEAMIHKRALGRARRIFADHQRRGTVGIHVVGAILGVIFNNEDDRIIPVGATRQSLDCTAQGKVVVGHEGSRARLSRYRPLCMIIRKVQQHKRWQFRSLAFLSSAYKAFELV